MFYITRGSYNLMSGLRVESRKQQVLRCRDLLQTQEEAHVTERDQKLDYLFGYKVK